MSFRTFYASGIALLAAAIAGTAWADAIAEDSPQGAGDTAVNAAAEVSVANDEGTGSGGWAPSQPESSGTQAIGSQELAVENAGVPGDVEMNPSADALAEAMATADRTPESEGSQVEEPAWEMVPAVAPDADLPELGQLGYDTSGRPGRIHLVAPGDTLWDISYTYLGSAWVWPSIWRDNAEIENPHLIHPGERIWISEYEMRRVSESEAQDLLSAEPVPETPAAPDLASEPELAPELERVEVLEPEVVAVPEPSPARVRATWHISSREHAGLVSAEVVEASTSVVDAVPDRLMLSQNDRLYVGVGDDIVSVGEQLSVFRKEDRVIDPETGNLLGYHVAYMGWLEVEETYESTSLAKVEESFGEIERGDRVTRREPLNPEIEVLDAPADIKGQVSFFPDSKTVAAHVDFVYLNRGSLDGLEVGSPLEVFRPAQETRDTIRNESVEVPSRPVAQLLVTKVGPDSSVAYVTHTHTEIERGDYFRGATQDPHLAAR